MPAGRICRWIAWSVVGSALTVLIGGWWLGIELLKCPIPGTVPMVPWTATMFVFAATALRLLVEPVRWKRWAGYVLSSLVVAAAATFFAEHVFGVDLGIDRLLGDVYPARPALETTFAFMALGLALALRNLPGRCGTVLAEGLAVTSGTVAVLLSVGHLYGYVYFPTALPIGMAVHTGLGLLTLSIGTLASHPQRGIASVATSRHGGGTLVRRLLVVAALTIPIAGVFGASLQAQGVFPPPGASVLGSTISLLVILGALLVSGDRLNRADEAREQAEAELAHWSAFIDAAPFGALFGSPDGRLLHVNAAFAQMHGWAPEDLVGRPTVELIPPQAREALEVQLAELDRLGRLRWESEGVRKDGRTFPLMVDAAAVKGNDGELLYRIAYVQDITDERRAKEAEARLVSLVASADDAIMASDLQGVVRAWNHGAERLYGYSAAEVIGRKLDEVYPLGTEEHTMLLERLQRGEMISGFETERVRKDGTRVPVSLTMSRIQGPHGAIGISTISRDITVQRNAERVLAEGKDDLAQIAQATIVISTAIAAIPETGLGLVLDTIANEARKLTGSDCADVALTSLGSQLAPLAIRCTTKGGCGDIHRVLDGIEGLGFASGERRAVRTAELRIKLGEPLLGVKNFLGVPVTFRGEARGALLLANKRGAVDFSERDQRVIETLATHLGSAIEISLLYQREAIERARLETILAQLPEGVIVLDTAGEPVHENAAALAYRAGEGAPQPYDFRSPSGEPVPVSELPLARAFANGDTLTNVEMVLYTRDGERVPVLVSASPIVGDGKRMGAAAVFRNIRAIKDLERMREEWTSVIAHDLCQPITSIQLTSELLSRLDLSERAAGWVEKLRAEVHRLNVMIRDLLDTSKLEAHRMTLRVAPIMMAHAFEAALGSSALAGRCHVHVEPGLPPVLADAVRLAQILGNLLSNAVKYGTPDTPIVLSATRDGGAVRITVANHGPRILADEIPTLFDRFTRCRTAGESRVEGTGLGLYICKGLVEAQGGRIWVESTPGETSFHVTLPVAPDRLADVQ